VHQNINFECTKVGDCLYSNNDLIYQKKALDKHFNAIFFIESYQVAKKLYTNVHQKWGLVSGTHGLLGPKIYGTSTATHLTQHYTTALLLVLPWYQNLPLIIYLYDAGRPGPPWPLPTNKFLCILSMSDTKDTLSTLPGFQQNPTDIRPSCAWKPTSGCAIM